MLQAGASLAIFVITGTTSGERAEGKKQLSSIYNLSPLPVEEVLGSLILPLQISACKV